MTPPDTGQEPMPADNATPGDVQDAGPNATAGAVAGSAAPDSAARRRRRRKMALVFLLLSLVSVFLLFGGWYLWFRKPISELPIPPIVQEPLPHYSFSIYGVTQPVGISVSPSGDRIYVAETGGERLVRIFSGKGDQIAAIMPPKSTPGSRIPVYIALDPLTGDVYVSDRISSSIYVYDKDGAYRRTFAPKPRIESFRPLGLAFDPQGNLYVADVGEPFHRILVFGRDGSLQRTIGTEGQFWFPNGLAVDLRGDLVVADGNNGRLVIIDTAGRQVGVVPRGVASGELGLPRGTAVDDEGRLYVADATGQGVRVYRIDKDTGRPTYLGTLGVEGVGDGQFEYPHGVATDTRARLYVSDWWNNRVQVWTY